RARSRWSLLPRGVSFTSPSCRTTRRPRGTPRRSERERGCGGDSGAGSRLDRLGFEGNARRLDRAEALVHRDALREAPAVADDFASDPRDGVPLVRLAKRVTGAALRVVAHVDQDPGPA